MSHVSFTLREKIESNKVITLHENSFVVSARGEIVTMSSRDNVKIIPLSLSLSHSFSFVLSSHSISFDLNSILTIN